MLNIIAFDKEMNNSVTRVIVENTQMLRIL